MGSYVKPEQLRTFLQFDANDYPTKEDMEEFIDFAEKQIGLDIDSSNTDILFIATMFLSKVYVLRALASRSVAKGYITINAEGRNITKAFQELVLDAENAEKDYTNFTNKLLRREATSTNFMDDTTIIDDDTRQKFIDIMNSTQNGMDWDSSVSFYGRATRG